MLTKGPCTRCGVLPAGSGVKLPVVFGTAAHGNIMRTFVIRAKGFAGAAARGDAFGMRAGRISAT